MWSWELNLSFMDDLNGEMFHTCKLNSKIPFPTCPHLLTLKVLFFIICFLVNILYSINFMFYYILWVQTQLFMAHGFMKSWWALLPCICIVLSYWVSETLSLELPSSSKGMGQSHSPSCGMWSGRNNIVECCGMERLLGW